MNNTENHIIRPAGRHILTIGRDLIQDRYAAIVELVKNAYDADSPSVNITFEAAQDRRTYSICVEDRGHGMSRETVVKQWMVPSTDDKLKRGISPKGRIMQGRKGVGRYAASILGKDLLLETVTPTGEKTTALIEWDKFEAAEYLDNVDILIETTHSPEPSGTRLTINGDQHGLADWDQPQLEKLRFELKKLISPVNLVASDVNAPETFHITLCITDFIKGQTSPTIETIKPYPIFELFDYKISGKIDASGTGLLEYACQKARNTIAEKIPIALGSPTGCGELDFDIRVYDREKESIETLIGRGLKDEFGQYLGKLEARQLLNDYNGIGVYRHGFRIRPLGDADFDWLKLNEQRIQNPSMRIGSNQVIGYVKIQAEDKSGLIEKSARDGLRENTAYDKLRAITKVVISKLEENRFAYRKKAGLSRPVLKVERQLEQLFAFDELKKGIRARLARRGIPASTAEEVIAIISKEEDDKNKIADEIRQAVAIYQGQATLGKIINVVLHEGRRPLNYFKNQIPNLTYWYELFSTSADPEALKRFMPIASGVAQNADVFVKLFSRLDPLAAGKRSDKIPLALTSAIETAFAVFHAEMEQHKVKFQIVGPSALKYTCWPQDIYVILTNLVDNSIYWLSQKAGNQREIQVLLHANGDKLAYIDYRDTGPGIEPALIASEVIFEPQFSTKPNGTGLGLAIAGEAASRNGLDLKAFESATGAYFRLQPRNENKE